MINVLFYIQYHSMGSSSRGIQSGGRILDFGDLCDVKFMQEIMIGKFNIMYQVGRGRLTNIKSMTLKEFEAIFYPHGYLGNVECLQHLLGAQGKESIFRKEITDKYGPKKDVIKTTTVYNPGDIITGVDNVEYLYMGNIKQLNISVDGRNVGSLSGHFYIPVRTDLRNASDLLQKWLTAAANNIYNYERHFLKSKRKVVANTIEKTDFRGFQGEQIIEFVLPNNYIYGNNRKLRANISV